jgi:protein-S-isoprenylcysteine O-methyltransferase Ste14
VTDEGSGDQRIVRRAWGRLIRFQLLTLLPIFGPAETLRYWQGWVYWAICSLCFGWMTLDVIRTDLGLLVRRMRGGASSEVRLPQKIIHGFLIFAFITLLVVSSLDWRRGWSQVSVPVVLAGDLAIVLGCYVIHRVFRANRFAAATVRVEKGQSVIDSGPYAVVRHPMYAGSLGYLFGTPLALGSAWGLLISLVILTSIIVRLLDEENVLIRELAGYADYRRRVRFRLVPGIW